MFSNLFSLQNVLRDPRLNVNVMTIKRFRHLNVLASGELKER